MSLEFEFPDTGEGVTEGTFLEWLVEEGEEVEEDQTVAEIETDKAVVDVPSPAHGTVKQLKAEPGDTVKVGEVILEMETGDDVDGEELEEPELEEAEETGDEEPEEEVEETGAGDEDNGEEEVEEIDGAVTGSSGDALALPKVRKLAREKGMDLSKIDGSGEDGRVTEADVKNAAGEGTAAEQEETQEAGAREKEVEEDVEDTGEVPANVDVNASPSVRQLAREKGIDLEGVEGSGKGGKVTRQDVLDMEEGGQEVEAQGETVKTDLGEVERVDLSGIRKSIGEKMKKSRFTAPHVTHVEKADVTKLVELREEKKEEVDAHLTYLPFIMKAVLVGLEQYPDLNAELDEENDEIVRKKYYDFNIAVDTERGLMVPKVEDVDDRTIVELAREIDEKVEETRSGELDREDMRGGTFSITNLGVISGEEFTPIINYPQVAILGIGKIQQTAEVVDGEVVPRHTVKLSLSYDHRVIDGATGARFMKTVVENLEDPGELLMEI
ncbi:MAG: 2-oxo acid dehydrogenase subunit E2 [Candidatus Nanohaloarchaea archaeon]